MPGFVYPYNFVSFPREPNGTAKKPSTLEPARLRDFAGLNGQLSLSLKILTHLAIPDVSKGSVESGHKRYPFFRKGASLAIPGTSIKGMIRSVMEALTNSCLSQLTEEPLRHRKRVTRLRYSPHNEELTRSDQTDYIVPYEKTDGLLRVDPDQSVKAGRIAVRDGKWYVEPMAWVYLWTDPRSKVGPLGDELREKRNALLKDSDQGEFDRDAATCHLRELNGKEATLTVPFWCRRIGESQSQGGFEVSWRHPRDPTRSGTHTLQPGVVYHLQLDPGHKGEGMHWGRNNEIIALSRAPFPRSFSAVFERTGDERLWFRVEGFLRIAGHMQDKKGKGKHGDFLFVAMNDPPDPVSIPDQERDNLREAYKEANKENPFGLRELRPGQTVWYQVNKRFGFGASHLQIGFAQIFPFVSPFSVQDKIPETHRPCAKDPLCPCCRLFGLAGDQALASRLRFSDAIFLGEPRTRFVRLRELSSPRPSYELFYLQPATRQGRPDSPNILPPNAHNLEDKRKRDWVEKTVKQLNRHTMGYEYGNKDSHARGRKFYLHHGAKFNLEHATDNSTAGLERRVTVEVLEPTANGELAFSIAFRNLQPWELGLLLLALELPFTPGTNSSHAHKLGMGRPLGLGSVKVELNGSGPLHVEDFRTAYGSWDTDRSPVQVSKEDIHHFLLVGLYWLIREFCPPSDHGPLLESTKKIAEQELIGHLLAALVETHGGPGKGLSDSEDALKALRQLIEIRWHEGSMESLLASSRVLPQVALSLTSNYQKCLDRCFDEAPESCQELLMEACADEEGARKILETVFSNAEAILKESFPRILPTVLDAVRRIPHVSDLLTILQWDPVPYPSRLPVRYPHYSGRPGKEQDARHWFNLNRRPLPFPDELERHDPWTLVDEVNK